MPTGPYFMGGTTFGIPLSEIADLLRPGWVAPNQRP